MKKKYNLNLNEIGERLKYIRDTIGYTLEKMGDITGFSTSLISAAEKGQKKPSAIYLFALLEQFNVNLNYVFSGKGSMFLSGSAPKKEPTSTDDANFQEMIHMLENVPIVKYALMSEYLLFKSKHTDTISKVLETKK